MRRVLLAISAIALASGCYFARSPTRPIPALAVRRDPGARASCLVIFVPGLMDGPDSFLEHGFARTIAERTACDSVAVDLTYRYYFGGRAGEVLWEDLLAPAVARGYEEIWIVGTSMGSLGAALLAREHAERIDGIIMLSPYLGLEDTVAEIERAGGLASWRPPPLGREIDDATFTLFVWSWLRGYADDPDAMPALYVGWAEGERLEPTARLLAATLPDTHSLRAPGPHGWTTWRPLFEALLSRTPLTP